MKTLLEEVKGFDPYNEQEEADKELLMTYLTMFDDIFYYKNFDYPEKPLKYKHIRRISD